MKELMKEINKAYQLVSSVPVSGDAIDAIAAARAKMRNVYIELGKMKAEENSVEGETEDV